MEEAHEASERGRACPDFSSDSHFFLSGSFLVPIFEKTHLATLPNTANVLLWSLYISVNTYWRANLAAVTLGTEDLSALMLGVLCSFYVWVPYISLQRGLRGKRDTNEMSLRKQQKLTVPTWNILIFVENYWHFYYLADVDNPIISLARQVQMK